jgi:hypothetical protein
MGFGNSYKYLKSFQFFLMTIFMTLLQETDTVGLGKRINV